ncbi:hypothetical protein A6R74_18260 [Halomonas sp. ALS9]|nr:hypothetical protein A6R74_18260 [Halomonas sp. ALS9]
MNAGHFFDWLFCIGFLLLYAWGVWCGIQLIENHAKAARSNFRFWLVQVPLFSSPLLGYFFASGAFFTVWIGLDTWDYSFNFVLGSSFQYSFLNSYFPPFVGVNILALLLSGWFYRKAYGSESESTPNDFAN